MKEKIINLQESLMAYVYLRNYPEKHASQHMP